MSAQKRSTDDSLTKLAKNFVHRLAKTISENDPEKEKQFQESENARDEQVQRQLKSLFKRENAQKKPRR